jgi:hypothetical protein
VRYNISYEAEKSLNVKIINFVRRLEIINQIFKPSLVFTHTRTQIYKAFDRLTLFYVSETWTVREN